MNFFKTYTMDNDGLLGHKMSAPESQAINSLRFLCIVSVVMLHSHVNQYATPETLTFLKQMNRVFYIFSPLPVLFLLSGYLFFYHVGERYRLKEDYGRKLRSRVKGLLVPYLIWNTVGLAVTCVLNKDFIIHSFNDFLNCYWPLDPMGHPEGRAIWFIRNLLFFSIVSPIYYWVVKYLKHFTLLLIAGLYLWDLPVDYLYFNVYLLAGSYLGYYKISLAKLASLVSWKTGAMIYMVLMLVHVFFQVRIYFLEFIPFFVLYGLLLKHKLPEALSHSSMFIYVSHLYIAYAVTHRYVALLPAADWALLVAMPLSFVTTFGICYFTYLVLHRFSPKLVGWLTGGR